jgi:hypothetical protein
MRIAGAIYRAASGGPLAGHGHAVYTNKGPPDSTMSDPNPTGDHCHRADQDGHGDLDHRRTQQAPHRNYRIRTFTALLPIDMMCGS